ncbi:hypothetical protein WR25_18559 [Diploscapter pachys]|uniref:Golgi to ER traffic protein 4 n=1 Tax=Diploscapter pachys TaxID=2018661 RepID=A0A2A2K8B3_9BILA|nr:hypothetical protein WR25_18559 [Diploscapter pachys]
MSSSEFTCPLSAASSSLSSCACTCWDRDRIKSKSSSNHGAQTASCLDLAELYADTLNSSGVAPSKKIFDNIQQLLKLLPSSLNALNEVSSSNECSASAEGQTDSKDLRKKFISTVIKWSQKVATKSREKKRGIAELHYILAKKFEAEGDFNAARVHYLLSEQPEEFGQFLIDSVSTDHNDPDELSPDVLVAHAVLQLLCLHRVKTASSLLQYFASRHPSIRAAQPPYENPLLNFLHHLIITIPKRNTAAYLTLVEKYIGSLEAHPSFKSYVDKIGQIFFGVPPPAGQGMGLLGNLFKGLLSDEKKEEEVFSDSDMDEPVRNVEMDEEGYATAEDEMNPAVPRQRQAQRAGRQVDAPARPQMQQHDDDLD